MTIPTTTPPWTLLILARQPLAGRSKTRLCPPLTPTEAASVAEAALFDTLDVATRSSASQVLVALAGDASYLDSHRGLTVFEQSGRDLNDRLEHAWATTEGRVVQIGSDTPQLSPDDLDDVAALLAENDAVLGPAEDGGWWVLAQRQHKPGIFSPVVMSSPTTFAQQLIALRSRHKRVALTRPLPDLDFWEDALKIANQYPELRTSTVVRRLDGA